MSEFKQILNKFNKLKVLVVGEAMLDTYFYGESNRLCREAPVPIVDVRSVVHQAGGAANTAVNAAEQGAEVTFMSSAGRDEEGVNLKKLLKNRRVQCQQLILDRNRKTLTKKRILAGDQLLLRFDSGSTNQVDEHTEEYFIRHLIDFYSQYDAVIISDYGYGILTNKIRAVVQKLQSQAPKILTVDAKYLNLYKDFPVTLVKPNFAEISELLVINKAADEGQRAEQIISQRDRILNLTQAKIIAVTIDSEGAVVFDRNSLNYRTFTKKIADSQAAGAGDVYTVAFTLSLSANASVKEAADLASAAAAVAISRQGTACCSQSELKNYLLAHTKYLSDKQILKEVVARLKQAKKKIVFTNGCFDILHSGHISYLSEAKALGDVLIVGINSDASIKRLKGPHRPVNNLADRIKVLAGLGSLDYITSFNEDVPISLVKIIKPEVYVKGGDYTKDFLPEAQVVESFNGVVKILPFVKDYSTTRIINRISQFH